MVFFANIADETIKTLGYVVGRSKKCQCQFALPKQACMPKEHILKKHLLKKHILKERRGKEGTERGRGNSLAARTSIAPDIPGAWNPLLSADLADLGARDALVVAVVPFADVFGDLDRGLADEAGACVIAVCFPRQFGFGDA